MVIKVPLPTLADRSALSINRLALNSYKDARFLMTRRTHLLFDTPPSTGHESPAPILDESGGNRFLKTFAKPKGV
jgi:hypothetical protein